MKKQIGKLSAITLTVALLVGCSTNSPVTGGLYTGVTHSGVSTGGIFDNSIKDVKKGVSSCTAILGLVAVGDCSEDAAKRNGRITNIHSVYHESTSVWFLFSQYETIVTGE